MRRPDDGSGGTGWLRIAGFLKETLGSEASDEEDAMEWRWCKRRSRRGSSERANCSRNAGMLPSTAITLNAPVRLSVSLPAFDNLAEHMPLTAAIDGGLDAANSIERSRRDSTDASGSWWLEMVLITASHRRDVKVSLSAAALRMCV